MSKKRMKAYFASLPGRTSVKLAHDDKFDALPGRTSASATHDLSEYAPVSLRNSNTAEASAMMKPVNVEDIEAALSEMLPLVSDHEYFIMGGTFAYKASDTYLYSSYSLDCS